jgi:hypothetical protein
MLYFSPSKPCGNICPSSVNQLIFVMVKCGVLFEVRTGLFLDIGFKEFNNLKTVSCKNTKINSSHRLIERFF